jgi:hypothetical protein
VLGRYTWMPTDVGGCLREAFPAVLMIVVTIFLPVRRGLGNKSGIFPTAMRSTVF